MKLDYKWICILLVSFYPALIVYKAVSQVAPDLDTYPYNHSKLKPIIKMKQCTIVFPKTKAKEVAKFLAEQGVVTNLSWMSGDGFWSDTVTAIICFPDDKEDKVKANLQKWIKE